MTGTSSLQTARVNACHVMMIKAITRVITSTDKLRVINSGMVTAVRSIADPEMTPLAITHVTFLARKIVRQTGLAVIVRGTASQEMICSGSTHATF